MLRKIHFIDLSNNKVMENTGWNIDRSIFRDGSPNASLEFVLINGVELHNHLVKSIRIIIYEPGRIRQRDDFQFVSSCDGRDEYSTTLEKIFTIIITDDPVEDNTAPLKFFSMFVSFRSTSCREDRSVFGNGHRHQCDPKFPVVGRDGSLRDHFHLDTNGSLLLASALDFETNQSMQIRAIVVDEYNGSLQGEFILQVIDIFEDLDGDGVEDHNDLDDDGDGLRIPQKSSMVPIWDSESWATPLRMPTTINIWKISLHIHRLHSFLRAIRTGIA